ncbi:hypothetical protein [Mycolicibacterium moriokaense]|uniref:hypothetical protein n=1 Tax=Mycolicibacterium moriokaense TaxID=39691 RepID=UPI0013D65CED|nr:hypothetical protein [Mycolicibacterium moriokaense]MCV7040917.1 hypothetical protein [Mycolicibacterium moriokaense]
MTHDHVRYGRGLPVEDGLPAPDGHAEDLDHRSQSWTAAIAQHMKRWLGGD